MVVVIGDKDVASGIDGHSIRGIEVGDATASITQLWGSDDRIHHVAAGALALEAMRGGGTTISAAPAVFVVLEGVCASGPANSLSDGAFADAAFAGLRGKTGISARTAIVFVCCGVRAHAVATGGSDGTGTLSCLAELTATTEISALSAVSGIGLGVDADVATSGERGVAAARSSEAQQVVGANIPA